MKSIDKLTNQVADLTTQNRTLQQKVNDLLSQISVGNKVRFSSKSQKGIKKNAPVQDREKDKDDFDGTNGAVMSSVSQADATSADTDPESAEQAQKSYENRIGLKYQTMNADNRIVHESDVNLLPEGEASGQGCCCKLRRNMVQSESKR
jgi:cobalamin biosynthesis Mg chelatase CobN